jgi:hypothetical protein
MCKTYLVHSIFLKNLQLALPGGLKAACANRQALLQHQVESTVLFMARFRISSGKRLVLPVL